MIRASTKRVKLSLTYEELYALDMAAMGRLGDLQEDSKSNDPETVAEYTTLERLRNGRILPMVNRWYDLRRAVQEPDYRRHCEAKGYSAEAFR